MNIENYCRLCALPRYNLLQIFDGEGFRLNILESINKCLKIEIREKDHLPRAVCPECSEKLTSTRRFIDASFEAQETLQRILEETHLLKKESCFAYDDSLGDGSKLSADSLASVFEQENEISRKTLISMDDVDSSLLEAYVENLNSRNSCPRDDHNFLQSLVGKPVDEVSGRDFPRAFSFFVASKRCDSGGKIAVSSKDIPEDPADSSSSVAEETLRCAEDYSKDVREGSIRINKRVFEESRKKFSGKKQNVLVKGKKMHDVMENEEKSGDSGVRLSEDEHENKKERKVLENSRGTQRTVKKGHKEKSASFDDVSWPCAQCDQHFSKYDNLRFHYASVHGIPTTHKCPVCDKKFTKSTNFYSHLKKHKPTFDTKELKPTRSKLSCDECDKKFSNRKLLDAHMVVHSDVRPYPCTDCGKNFRHQSLLELHAKSHLPLDLKNKFQCDLCDKRFTTRPNLITHRRIHLGVRNYTCDQCGKSFIQKGNLDVHLSTHSSDKPFSCDICEKGFKTVMQLRKHHSVHTGDKPHQCDVCGRMFRERGTLRDHSRIHTGAMPFSCEFCGKTFRFKGILTTHRRQHTGEKPYSCQECQHHFTNWPNYNKHMKRRHGINTSKASLVKPDPSVSSGSAAPTTTPSEVLDIQPDITDHETYDQLPGIDNLADPDIILNNVYNVTSSLCPNNFNTAAYHPFVSNSPLVNFYNLSHLATSVPLDTINFAPSMIDVGSHSQNR